jgi:hypothetical protein
MVSRHSILLTHEAIDTIGSALRAIENTRSEVQTEAIERQRNTALIAQAAQVDYLRMAEKTFIAMVVTSIIYGFGVYLIGSILVNQAESVMQSAGIGEPANILDWWKTPHAK